MSSSESTEVEEDKSLSPAKARKSSAETATLAQPRYRRRDCLDNLARGDRGDADLVLR
jgi:hypothetical protein